MFALTLLIGRAASAQPVSDAEEAFHDGLVHMKRNDYVRACAALEHSQRLDPQYGTELDLAICYVRIHRLYDAWKLYCEVAASDPDRDRGARAARAADEIWPYLSKLHLRFDRTVAAVQVTVDAIDVTPRVHGEIAVDAGHHVIAAALPGAREFREDVDLVAGERREIQIAFAAAPHTPAPVQPAPVPAPASSSRASWGWLAIGSGSVLVIAGLAAGWGAKLLRDQAEANPDLDRARSLAERARSWGNVATVVVAVGGVAIGGGIYLRYSAHSRPLRLEAAAARSSLSLALDGAF